MRRMITDPGKILECNFKNDGRITIIQVPIKNLSDLPITFDLIFTTKTTILHSYAWYSSINDEVYGGGSFEMNGDNKGLITFYTELNSLITPEFPCLELQMVYKNDAIKEPPLSENDRVYVTNVTHLEQGVIEIA